MQDFCFHISNFITVVKLLLLIVKISGKRLFYIKISNFFCRISNFYFQLSIFLACVNFLTKFPNLKNLKPKPNFLRIYSREFKSFNR
jgi:hypothetical protein